MDLSEVVSITGKPGLYKVKAKSAQGLIVESMDENRKKLPVHNNFQIALLDEITIFSTEMDDLSLKTVFKEINKKDGLKPSVSPKDDASALRSYFREVAPQHDEERVYHSDLKKILKWYNILVEHGRINENEADEPEEEEKKKEEVKPVDKPKVKHKAKEANQKPKSQKKTTGQTGNKTAKNK